MSNDDTWYLVGKLTAGHALVRLATVQMPATRSTFALPGCAASFLGFKLKIYVWKRACRKELEARLMQLATRISPGFQAASAPLEYFTSVILQPSMYKRGHARRVEAAALSALGGQGPGPPPSGSAPATMETAGSNIDAAEMVLSRNVSAGIRPEQEVTGLNSLPHGNEPTLRGGGVETEPEGSGQASVPFDEAFWHLEKPQKRVPQPSSFTLLGGFEDLGLETAFARWHAQQVLAVRALLTISRHPFAQCLTAPTTRLG